MPGAWVGVESRERGTPISTRSFSIKARYLFGRQDGKKNPFNSFVNEGFCVYITDTRHYGGWVLRSQLRVVLETFARTGSRYAAYTRRRNDKTNGLHFHWLFDQTDRSKLLHPFD